MMPHRYDNESGVCLPVKKNIPDPARAREIAMQQFQRQRLERKEQLVGRKHRSRTAERTMTGNDSDKAGGNPSGNAKSALKMPSLAETRARTRLRPSGNISRPRAPPHRARMNRLPAQQLMNPAVLVRRGIENVVNGPCTWRMVKAEYRTAAAVAEGGKAGHRKRGEYKTGKGGRCIIEEKTEAKEDETEDAEDSALMDTAELEELKRGIRPTREPVNLSGLGVAENDDGGASASRRSANSRMSLPSTESKKASRKTSSSSKSSKSSASASPDERRPSKSNTSINQVKLESSGQCSLVKEAKQTSADTVGLGLEVETESGPYTTLYKLKCPNGSGGRGSGSPGAGSSSSNTKNTDVGGQLKSTTVSLVEKIGCDSTRANRKKGHCEQITTVSKKNSKDASPPVVLKNDSTTSTDKNGKSNYRNKATDENHQSQPQTQHNRRHRCEKLVCDDKSLRESSDRSVTSVTSVSGSRKGCVHLRDKRVKRKESDEKTKNKKFPSNRDLDDLYKSANGMLITGSASYYQSVNARDVKTSSPARSPPQSDNLIKCTIHDHSSRRRTKPKTILKNHGRRTQSETSSATSSSWSTTLSPKSRSKLASKKLSVSPSDTISDYFEYDSLG